METAKTVSPIFKEKKKRVWELDFFRGLAVLLMCWDHLMCDFVYLRGWFSNYSQVNNTFIEKIVVFANNYWDGALRFWGHYIFVFVFLFLVGTSCAFSRDNTRRGSLLGVVALAFTGGSLVLKKIGLLDYGIIFGILDCIALSILCAAAVDIATKDAGEFNKIVPVVLGIAIIGAGIGARFWDVDYSFTFEASDLIKYIIGTEGFGDDWFGLFPYVGVVLVGMYWGKCMYQTRRSLLPMLDGKWNKPIRFVGRHALIFYILHQALLSGLVLVVCMCLGYRF